MDVYLSGYQAALDFLFARTTGAFKFGLERTQALLAELHDPHLAYPVIHVAGTNGKGSAVATAAALLRAKGLRVGTYTSPHLVDFRERILVNGVAISPEDVVEFIERWTPPVERIGASFFEATTALAFTHFRAAEVDVAVIETGLGGRLDSTNVVQPVVAGVTAIGFDHTEYLGNTLEAIAREKAGIFKQGVPAVIGETAPGIRSFLANEARSRGASPVRVVADEISISDVALVAGGTRMQLRARGEEATVETPLVGEHQAGNFAFAFTLLDAAGDRYRVSLGEASRSVRDVRLPGRFQRVGHWLFDVAHNPDGARTLAMSIAATQPAGPVVALLCVLGDKDWRGMLEALAPVVSQFVLTDAPTAPASRRWPLDEVLAFATSRGWSASAVPGFDEALVAAEAIGATVVVTGSFHTVGDAMTRLQVSPLTG